MPPHIMPNQFGHHGNGMMGLGTTQEMDKHNQLREESSEDEEVSYGSKDHAGKQKKYKFVSSSKR